MKKLTKNRLIAGMVLSAAFVAAIGVANHAIYTADAADAETGITGNFAMTDGMSIRKENPVGLRFATSVDSAFRASLEKKYSPEEYVYEFGTVLTVGEKQTIAPIKQWKDEAKTEYTMVIYEIPETDYATEISAKGYVTVYAQADINKETAIYTQYTSNEVSRSAAYVASAALNNGESGDALINYLKPVAKGITLSESKVTLSALNETKTLAATTNPVDYKAVWSSSNNSIVSVDKDGVITAKDYGKATITAKFGDYTATCEVSVPITADPLGFVASGATLSQVEKDGEQVIKVVSESGTSVGFKNVIENGIKGKFFDCGYSHITFDMFVESCSALHFYTSGSNVWTNGAGFEWKDVGETIKQGDLVRSYYSDLMRSPINKGLWFTVSMLVENNSDRVMILADGDSNAVFYLKNLSFGNEFPQEKEFAADSLGFIPVSSTLMGLGEKVSEGYFSNCYKMVTNVSNTNLWASTYGITFKGIQSGFFFAKYNWVEFKIYVDSDKADYLISANWDSQGANTSGWNFATTDYYNITDSNGNTVSTIPTKGWYTVRMKVISGASTSLVVVGRNSSDTVVETNVYLKDLTFLNLN